MQTDKQAAMAILEAMPETASPDQISEELAIWAALRRAEADVAAGRTTSHDEMRQRSAAWTTQ